MSLIKSTGLGLTVTLACYLTGFLEEAPVLSGCAATMISLVSILVRGQ